jgi:hypothetical protein
MTPTYVFDSQGTPIQCSICNEDVFTIIDSNHPKFCHLTSCGHRFHKKCIELWFSYSTHQNCPNCRTSLQPTTNELNTNELNTNELNTNELNTNELNTNELNTNELNTNEVNTNENPEINIFEQLIDINNDSDIVFDWSDISDFPLFDLNYTNHTNNYINNTNDTNNTNYTNNDTNNNNDNTNNNTEINNTRNNAIETINILSRQLQNSLINNNIQDINSIIDMLYHFRPEVYNLL